MPIEVEFLTRTGSTESARFFSRENADDYFDLHRGSGRMAGGTIVQAGARLREFGMLRGGVTVREARKLLAG